MKGVLTTVTTLRKYAHCTDCSRGWAGPNALAVAARHSHAYGHTVTAEQTTAHTYVPTRRTP